MSNSTSIWARRALAGAAVAVALVAVPSRAEAVNFGFNCITDNSVLNCAAGESQLLMQVTAGADSTVQFQFGYTAGATVGMTITDIYFDDANPTVINYGSGALTQSAGVDFETGSSNNLPGGNSITPQFSVTSNYTRDNGPGGVGNGIDALPLPSEWLRITFALTNPVLGLGETALSRVLGALADGTLRVGLHVQSIGLNRNSEGFVNTTVGVNPTDGGDGGNPVPEPASLMLLGSGLAGIAGAARRRRKAQAQAIA